MIRDPDIITYFLTGHHKYKITYCDSPFILEVSYTSNYSIMSDTFSTSFSIYVFIKSSIFWNIGYISSNFR